MDCLYAAIRVQDASARFHTPCDDFLRVCLLFLVNLVDVIEGFTSFEAREGAWAPFNFLADLLTAAVLMGMIGLIIRRFFVRPKDFAFPANVPLQPEVRAGILRDSLIVATFILFHVGSRLMFKSTQLALEVTDVFLPVSSLFAKLFVGMSPDFVEGLNHFFWWGALGSILIFIPYFPCSSTSISSWRRLTWR